MNMPDTKAIVKVLKKIKHPRGVKNILDLGMVQGLKFADGAVSFVLELPERDKDIAEDLFQECQTKISALKGVEKVSIILTSERKPPKLEPARKGISEKREIPGVGAVIAIASGKGGVGKSTVAVNLALAFKQLGASVGLLDADVYGPSAPKLLGLEGRPDLVDGQIQPIEKFGLKIISMGLMVDPEAPLIWRGPMVGKAIEQFLYEVNWRGLDILVVDMPPGTGDAQLTLAQKVPLAGVVIVSTPQDLALIDARKGLEMFRTIDIPILGIIENMSTFVCPHCGEASHIFSHGGAAATAKKLKVPFLGEIPLNMALRESSDAGTPLVATMPDSEEAKIFLAIAKTIKQGL
ncbi:MAG: MRP family ATP-binding protein [Alphaproteobacteria bacterium]|nr:MAG: MRP family ATP-binding protein [Alphaproteobacteria bacterium]